MSTFDQQLAKIKNDKGFIADLDQAAALEGLKLYGSRKRVEDEKGLRRRPPCAHAYHETGVYGKRCSAPSVEHDGCDIEATHPTYLWEAKASCRS